MFTPEIISEVMQLQTLSKSVITQYGQINVKLIEFGSAKYVGKEANFIIYVKGSPDPLL